MIGVSAIVVNWNAGRHPRLRGVQTRCYTRRQHERG